MPKAVRFEEYGGVEVLNVVEVPMPEPGPGQVLVKVKTAGINPGEAKVREGLPRTHSHGAAGAPCGRSRSWRRSS
jgi:NADPH:quinone reductase-like Zn-dependent oxidoreductase